MTDQFINRLFSSWTFFLEDSSRLEQLEVLLFRIYIDFILRLVTERMEQS